MKVFLSLNYILWCDQMNNTQKLTGCREGRNEYFVHFVTLCFFKSVTAEFIANNSFEKITAFTNSKVS